MTGNSAEPTAMKSLRLLAVLGIVLGLLAPFVRPGSANAAAFGSPALRFTAGGITANGNYYAKSSSLLTLTVNTDSATRCVEVGSFATFQTSNTAKTSWSFTGNSPVGEGIQSVTVSASNGSNANGCTGTGRVTTTATYILDNTGPVVTASITPPANGAGWNNSNVSINWSATDAGVGMTGGQASNPTPPSASQTVNTTGDTFTSTAKDALGNVGNGSVTVKLDKSAPSINGSRSPAANGFGWNNTDVAISFTCTDTDSGIKSCVGPPLLSGNGANQSSPGVAVNNADLVATTTVSGINIDKTAPTLSGVPTTSPNAAGWYKGNVTIQWNCADQTGLSGIAGSCPANSTISSEGENLTASAAVSDRAGNTTNATSSPAVKIDKTAPNTTATAPAGWNNTDVSVSLNPADSLSGVAATFYKLDGGAPQSGTSVVISNEGVHTLQFWSVDRAGNAEAAKTVEVKIDYTPPTINHTQSPPAVNGWNNTDVTVTFTCDDVSGSGIASCTSAQTITSEGKGQPVTGTAVDNAGNSTTGPATVSIDKTAPTISAAADRAPNSNGWYSDDVTVAFTCGDTLSGIDSCAATQIKGEGASQSVSGSATDAAGNSATSNTVVVSVDKTAPNLSGAASTTDWTNSDVSVTWSCSDALSGIDGVCPAASTVTGEGNSLSASASVSDKAGNTANSTVSGIKIDRTAPVTSATVPAPLASGWYAGAVHVTLAGMDSLSGVDETFYRVDNGEAQRYSGPFSHSLKGSHTITFWSVDNAGNTEALLASNTVTLKIDDVAPTITGSRVPAANGFGWNNVPVAVSFTCSDAESGIAGCSDPVTLSNPGANQSATGNAEDNAGNASETTVSNINIDLTAPTLTGGATTSPNAFGWYKGNVTIAWTGQDGLSGIDPATQPVNSVISGEGANLGAGPVSISDKAGNISSGEVSGIKIDRTPPTISGATMNEDGTARSANAGWFNSAVRVRFSCADALSGVQECAHDEVLTNDGANQSVSGSATDNADNSAGTTVIGLNIDSQAPKTDSDLQCASRNGFCRGSRATVVLTAVDQAGLSGIKEIRYSTNNGSSWQTVAGASASVDINLSGSGRATVLFFAVDKAGNSETQDGVEVRYDTIAPTITHSVSPVNAAGWSNADAAVTFTAKDDTDGSGVAVLKVDGQTAATGTQNPITQQLSGGRTVSMETAGITVGAWAEDFAGNDGTDSVAVKLDKTKPTINGAATTSPNANGWYNGPVTVKFTCADALSGIAECEGWSSNNNTGIVFSQNGANQSISGTTTDKAGNTGSTTVGGINIDSDEPTISSISLTNGAIYTLGAVPTASCTASDSGSGLISSSCRVNVTGGLANGVGGFSFTATATDNAGNTVTQTGSFRVIYRWGGFLQPINDTAHQVDQNVSIFKGASTVPVKFQLKRADSTVVQANSLPQWLNPLKGSPTTAAADETVYTTTPTPGGQYRWTGSPDNQYIYNWGTTRSQIGSYYRIGVTLDDGMTYYVNIGLR